ncbi:MAG TPA: hypothetical protein VFY06_11075 [Verrucomicrobiae bacterium]|nr:hypothetical protein [Verrucomicrobiae bacterium]
MSLINDALKRARDKQRNNPPSGATPLPPVESPTRGGGGWILALAAILFLGAAGLILGAALWGHRTPSPMAAKVAAIPAPAPMVAVAPAAPPPPPAPVAITNAPPVTNTNPHSATVVVERLPKVQGIIFNSSRPVAIMNGQTVNVGDHVGDFQVKQILQSSVVLQRPDGTQKTLGIGD